MRKLFITCIALSSVLFISIIINVILSLAWRGEALETKTLSKENQALEAKLEASKENNENLKLVGERFVNTMFVFDNKTAPELKDKLLKQTEGKAKEKLLVKPDEDEMSEIPDTKTAYSSKVDIKESSFSRKNETAAIITIHFDQVFTISRNETRNAFTMKVFLEKKADQWKVNDFETQQQL